MTKKKDKKRIKQIQKELEKLEEEYRKMERWLILISLLSDPFWKIEENLLVQRCSKDESYRETVLKEIENLQSQ